MLDINDFSIQTDLDYTLAPDIVYRTPVFGIGEEFTLRVCERHSGWDCLRDLVVKKHPYCGICKKKKQLQVHHILPFHLYPELELTESNLRVLCISCHITWGHLGDWKSFNPDLDRDIERILNRPYQRI